MSNCANEHKDAGMLPSKLLEAVAHSFSHQAHVRMHLPPPGPIGSSHEDLKVMRYRKQGAHNYLPAPPSKSKIQLWVSNSTVETQILKSKQENLPWPSQDPAMVVDSTIFPG